MIEVTKEEILSSVQLFMILQTIAHQAPLSLEFSKQQYWSGLPFPFPDFHGGSDGKASVYNAGDLGLIPGSGRSPGEGKGNPLQYYCLENPMDRGAW